MGEPLPVPITIGAYDNRESLIDYLPVPLYFETTNGTVAPSNMVLTSGGLARVIWTLDGNVYNIVQIGDQVWMKENLRYLSAGRLAARRRV